MIFLITSKSLQLKGFIKTAVNVEEEVTFAVYWACGTSGVGCCGAYNLVEGKLD